MADNAQDIKQATTWLCWIALRASDFWDFVDKRDVDKHAMAWLVALCSWDVTKWGMSFASAHPEMEAIGMAAVMAAVGAPVGLFAGAVVNWYFKRQDT